MEFIDLKTQYQRIEPCINDRIKSVLEHGQYIMGPEVEALESALGDFASVDHVITCSSGTDALLMILMALGVKKSDAIFVPSFTFPATPEVVALLGAHPVFVDVDPVSFNIDPESLLIAIECAIAHNLNPKAIMAVDLYGQPADYDTLAQIAKRFSMTVIADAAQSFGATYKNQNVGSLTHVTATSFFPAKPLGCYGDGGAILTNDNRLADLLRSIRVHGKGFNKYDNVRVGLNGRLDTIQAAILLEKLKIFPDEIKKRQHVALRYAELLNDFQGLPRLAAERDSVWAQYTLKLKSISEREYVQSALKDKGIPTVVYYPKPTHHQLAYQNFLLPQQVLPVSEWLSQVVLSLPMHPYLSDETMEYIASSLKMILVEAQHDVAAV